jgi:hypothetical protein
MAYFQHFDRNFKVGGRREHYNRVTTFVWLEILEIYVPNAPRDSSA